MVLAVALWLASVVALPAQVTRSRQVDKKPISAAEFSRIVRLFSEEEGAFFSDNFVSNETSYLHVVEKFKELGVSGGAYLGVGPEQNFTYIAKTHPQIAFIVDIRREAIVQHLMYKAIFRLAKTRSQFLSWLLSRSLDGKNPPGPNPTAQQLVDYFSEAPTSDKLFSDNLLTIRTTIERNFEIPFSAHDQELLERIYSAFRQANLQISFRFAGYGASWGGGFPSLKDLLLEKDLEGNLGNFLASDGDFNYVRNLQNANRVIPVVGDFAGSKALAAVADYLRENGYAVSAFYTSNVEQFLFGDRAFDSFVANVRRLPIHDKSVIIRSFRVGWQGHPAQVPGHRMTTVLEKIGIFLNDYDEGLYRDYWSLISSHFISGNEP